MDTIEYQIYVDSFNKGKHKAYFLSCECGLCNQLKSFRSLSMYNEKAHHQNCTFIHYSSKILDVGFYQDFQHLAQNTQDKQQLKLPIRVKQKKNKH